MKKISGATFYFKKVFPTFWFGFIAFFIVTSLTSGATEASIMFLVMPLFMAAFGFVLFKKMVWDLADAVYDYQDYLLFRKGNIEQKVFLKDIVNINYTHMSAPERVVVQVRNEGPIGKELAFSLPHRFKFFSKSPLVQELILRVDRAKNT